jgi:hypothetical protein
MLEVYSICMHTIISVHLKGCGTFTWARACDLTGRYERWYAHYISKDVWNPRSNFPQTLQIVTHPFKCTAQILAYSCTYMLSTANKLPVLGNAIARHLFCLYYIFKLINQLFNVHENLKTCLFKF